MLWRVTAPVHILLLVSNSNIHMIDQRSANVSDGAGQNLEVGADRGPPTVEAERLGCLFVSREQQNDWKSIAC